MFEEAPDASSRVGLDCACRRGGQLIGRDLGGGFTERRQPPDFVLKLSDVARPRVQNEPLHGAGGKPHRIFRKLRGEPLCEQVREHRDFLPPFSKRRNLNRDDVQPIEQVLPEAILIDRFFQVAVGSEQKPHVDLDRVAVANRVDLAHFEEAKQFRLHVHRELADFVEKDVPPFAARTIP